ncbi:MAG: 4-alpha-glucanotransferase, partial [Myxococcales bacterium]|nr:4-alpha-glucanotransferase [Myxococcales bacterium]
MNQNPLDRRSAGLLLHPTSLPSPGPIGRFDDTALDFVSFLSDSGQSYWQVLPLNPPGPGNSPYSPPSAFALSELFVNPVWLLQDGLLTEDRSSPQTEHCQAADYAEAERQAQAVLNDAFMAGSRNEQLAARVEEFSRTNRDWLTDFARFKVVKECQSQRPWWLWPTELRDHTPEAMADIDSRFRPQLERIIWGQYIVQTHWERVRAAAKEKSIQIIGDVPIYVTADSSDVWSNRECFELASDGSPSVVAGVPPDYFSETGQLWGNPLYRWDQMAERDFEWWISRLRRMMDTVDVIRIDHFRAFDEYWEVDAGEETAINGRWRPGPGSAFFDAIGAALGEVPIIAEDLGIVGASVFALRDRVGLPGMKI